jgi:DNA-3-methyladenine glycosylase II
MDRAQQRDMQRTIPTRQPFSFAQSLTFIRRFPPCQGDYVLTDDSLTAAVCIAGEAVPFTLSETAGTLRVELADARHAGAIVARAAHFVGADDDLSELYAAAKHDEAFGGLVAQLYGLHHVRFLTLEEIAVYCVMMQRTPIQLASRMKRKFLERFGVPVEVAGHTLRAMPSIDVLAALEPAAIGEAIGHGRKGELIARVVRGVAAIGEPTLREAPYDQARDALLEISGVGPFSAAAILLRGLGRMDELPVMRNFEDAARVLYGRSYDEAAIRRRYGRQIGYWSFYLKTGVARLSAPLRD